MPALLRRLLNAIAPAACPACDSMSGMHYNRETGEARICSVCNGTGEANPALGNKDYEAMVTTHTRRLRRGRRRHHAA